MPAVIFIFLCLLGIGTAQGEAEPYLWLRNAEPQAGIVDVIPPPPGFERDTLPPSSFAQWLRHLPLKDGRAQVSLYNGRPKLNQDAHYAVIDIDVGREDLQQCADAVIRLRAEFLYSLGYYDEIHFKFTSGDDALWRRWIEGYRPVVGGGNVFWKQPEECDSSYACFMNYLRTVFTYAGTYSLQSELRQVESIADMEIGDIFIEGGFPGHAVIVVDMAQNPETGEKVFLLAQSYMPAQDIHILKNPVDSAISPWYRLNFGDTLQTPEWRFLPNQIKRF